MHKLAMLLAIFVVSSYGYWGFDAKGVIKTFKTNDKVVALTLDACGGSIKSSGYDKDLIGFLVANHIPATLFINSRWIDSNPKLFDELSKNPLFEIENHGTRHMPLSLNGLSAYNIAGTKNADEVKEEVLGNHEKVKLLIGRSMKFFRAGTAHYDDESVQIVESLGYKIVGFNINADAGATYNAVQIQKEMAKVSKGDIIIAHMNHPESHNAQGLSKAIIKLQRDGWKFVTLQTALCNNLLTQK